MSKVPMGYDYIREQGQTLGLGQKLMAIVAEGTRGRVYLAPAAEHEECAATAKPSWTPDLKLPDNPRDFKTPNYGIMTFGKLFTPRQLVALTTLSDLIEEAGQRICKDALSAGMSDDHIGLDGEGTGAKAYAEAASVYLAFAIDKLAGRQTTVCTWEAGYQKIQHTFGRQAIPMMWDYAEGNPYSESTGNFNDLCQGVVECVLTPSIPSRGFAVQGEAQVQNVTFNNFVSTDPPYYDNIGYANLSDFFYLWLRNSLREIYPVLLSTISAPKTEELVATPYRHGTKEKAEQFFLAGMTKAMRNLALQAHSSARNHSRVEQ